MSQKIWLDQGLNPGYLHGIQPLKPLHQGAFFAYVRL